ncbi:MAG TPA: thioredoxin domain-containing protein [Terriglobales bacterium]|nr:thioredoxin domain-containing protein [Terriglobales bacterium]
MFRKLDRLAVIVIVLLAVMAAAQQKPTSSAAKASSATTSKKSNDANLPSEETVNAFLQQMLGMNPSTTWKITDIKPSPAAGLAEVNVVISGPQGSQGNTFYVTEDGTHAITGQIMPFGAHPFDAARSKLEKEANGPSRGPANAPVTLVEFSDLQCPHCKDEQPNIDKLLAENKNVRLVYQNFPLPAHDWAAKAAAYADCIGRTSNDAFWKFIESVYSAQSDITAANSDEKLNGLADAAGAKSADVAACAAKPETVGRVEHSVLLGKSLGVTGTPTLYINGRQVGGVPYESLKSLVDFAAQPAK